MTPPTSSAQNTTNTSAEFSFDWVVDKDALCPPWWGRLASFIDVQVNHRLVLHARWQYWLPGPIGEAIVWPFYRFCCWTSRWDRPVYKRLEGQFNDRGWDQG